MRRPFRLAGQFVQKPAGHCFPELAPFAACQGEREYESVLRTRDSST